MTPTITPQPRIADIERRKDLTNQRFGKLIALGRVGRDKWYSSLWRCVCDCGKETIVSQGRLSTGNTKTCGCSIAKGSKRSKEWCERQSKQRVGANNPSWKGGVTSLRKVLRSRREYKEWRDLVFERDNYVCQNCFERGGVLHAHHVKEFAKHPTLRLEISNGKTLCKDCHNKHHQK